MELAVLSETDKESTAVVAPPLIERLHEYPAKGADLTNLVTYPPKLEPVPVKPLFFDAAWNYVEYPGRLPEPVAIKAAENNTSAKTAEQTGQQKKGWFGFGR